VSHLEPFTLEDVNAFMDMLSSVKQDFTDVGSHVVNYVVTDVGELDLDALASKLHGIFDPIGQLRDWFYDRLKELTSWFSDAVNSILRTFWDTIAGPVVDGIRSVVDSIWGYIQRIPGTVSDLVSWIRDQINSAWSWFESNFINPLKTALSDLTSRVASAVDTVRDFFTVTLPDLIASVPGKIQDAIAGAWDWIQRNLITPLGDALSDLINLAGKGVDVVREFFTETLPTYIKDIPRTIQEALAGVWDWIQANIVSPLQDAFSDFIDLVSKGIDAVGRFFTETLPTYIKQVPTLIQEAVSGAWDWIQRNIITPLGNALSEFINFVRGGLETVRKFFLETLPSYIKGIPKAIQDVLAGAWDWIQANIVAPLGDALRDFINLVGGGIEAVKDFFTETLPCLIEQVPKSIQDAVAGAWDWLQRNVIAPLSEALTKFINYVKGGLDTVAEFLAKKLPASIEAIGKELKELPSKAFEALKVAGLTIWDYITDLGSKVSEGFKVVGELLERASQYLDKVGASITGFVNAVLQLPNLLYERFKTVVEAFDKVREVLAGIWEGIQGFVKDPWGWLKDHILTPALDALQWLASRAWDGIKWLGEQLVGWVTAFWGTITSKTGEVASKIIAGTKDVAARVAEGIKDVFKTVLIDPLKAMATKISQAWFEALGVAKGGEVSLMYDIAWRFLYEYWTSTLVLYVMVSLFRALGDYTVEVGPEVLGSSFGGISLRLKLSEIGNALVQGIKDFLPSFLIGSFVGIGSTLMRPVEYSYRARFVANYDGVVPQMYSDVLADEIKKGAIINAFVETPGISEIKEWIRRQLVLTEGLKKRAELDKLIATMRAHLKLYGLPRWYVDYLSDTGEKLYMKFIDRFGAERVMLLSTLFELPTHSEMARMTQRDVFPGVDVMKRLGWVRGWNEDLTTMVYLLTFRYPSFEKLWTFYMRAVSGMLWFSPPDTIRKVFEAEAKEIGAGVPVAPLDIQSKITGASQLKAFELALNTYFKWLEYSNFSWFTDKTTMYGINIGREIYNALGGWTADSWLMADVAADIPTKIDMRWMSRYGIFLYMADKFGKAGVTYESYAPMVKALPALVEASAATPIQVDLRWFSKLIQSTGLHPAWVPVVTVAENIMAISDEMTLLRTGWLNLFKEGLLNVSKVEEYLAGLLVTSYLVGYWDPEAKVWKSGWINLPVRWLPHERRLLQLRMSIDRILDLYREVERYVVSGVRTLVITADKAIEVLKGFVSELDKHYSSITKEITGKEMHIQFDEAYEQLRIYSFTLIREIEALERARSWWIRVSGWLLYRIAQGYVTETDIEKMLEAVGNVIPLHEVEKKAYLELAKSVLSIVVRERYPTPTQLATLAEYVTISEDLIDKALANYQVPQEFRQVWKRYIAVRPLIDEIRRLISTYYRSKRYGISLPADVEKAVANYMVLFGLTEAEKKVRDLTALIEVTIAEYTRYRQLFEPTVSFLATLLEYVDVEGVEGFSDYISSFFNKLERIGVPKAVLTAVRTYIDVRPVKSDYKSLLTTALRAYRYGVITKDRWEEYLKKAEGYGFTKRELEIVSERSELELLIAESREYIPTPSMLATMAEYIAIPEELIRKVFIVRRIPEEWQGIWRRYIAVRPLSDDVRSLMYAYLRVIRYGYVLPKELEERVKSILSEYGVSEKELEIRGLAVALEAMRETIPTLGTLASMAEYIDIPLDYIKNVLEVRKVEKTFAQLWIKYVYARMISSEVNAVVAQYRRIYEYFFVPQEVAKKIEELMVKGGWTSEELKIFKMELDLRKDYRIMTYLIPTIRQFVTDAYYIPEWENLLNDLLKARGIEVEKYKKQVEYYKKLIRNRLVWRQVAWYRSQLIYAYANGVITKDELRRKLEKLKAYGLSDAEIELIMDGAELNRLTTTKIYGPR